MLVCMHLSQQEALLIPPSPSPPLLGEVIFDQNHPEHPPDIILSPKDEITHFNPDLEELSVSV